MTAYLLGALWCMAWALSLVFAFVLGVAVAQGKERDKARRVVTRMARREGA